MGTLKIGFDLDGVILNNSFYKAKLLKELYGVTLPEWKLCSNLIDDYIPDKAVRHHIGKLAGTNENAMFVDANCICVFEQLIAAGHQLFLVSRRGKSNQGIESAKKSISDLNITKYFERCIFCEDETKKIDEIITLSVDFFFDDRIEVIERLNGRIPEAILFDYFATVESGVLLLPMPVKTACNFQEILNKINEYSR